VPNIEDCLRQVMAIQGALGVSLVDYPSGSTIGSAGRGPSGHDEFTAAGAAKLIYATVDTAAFATVGRPDQVEDIVITAGNGYHLLHLMSNGFGDRLVLYVWLDRALGNLAITQRSLRTIGLQFGTDVSPVPSEAIEWESRHAALLGAH
jgi:hypothetical protein